MNLKNKGSYVLILRLTSAQILQVGKLGPLHFQPGYYAYTGSAFGPGGLGARLKHHLSPLKPNARLHWHIDYFRQAAAPAGIWINEGQRFREHIFASILRKMTDDGPSLKGFGCSDCSCPSHLFFFRETPDRHLFSKLLKKICPDDPPVFELDPLLRQPRA
jgi:Uri superfamily endonuclease